MRNYLNNTFLRVSKFVATTTNNKLRLSISIISVVAITLAILFNAPETVTGLIFWGFALTLLGPDIRATLYTQPFSLPAFATTAAETSVAKAPTNTYKKYLARKGKKRSGK